MLHVTGVIISTVFFLHLLRMGHEKRDCIALIGLVIVGLKRVFVLLYLLPFEVRGDGKHVGRYRHNRLPLASVVVYHREHTGPRGRSQNSSFSSLSHKSFAFY